MRRNFNNLLVYKKAMLLAVSSCKLAEKIHSSRLKGQLMGSTISIPSNIAEGAERETEKQFKTFLNYASASCAEEITQLRILLEIQPELAQDANALITQAEEVHRMVRGLMKKLAP